MLVDLSPSEILLLLKAFRPDRLFESINTYLQKMFGPDFKTEKNVRNLLKNQESTKTWTPFLFFSDKGHDVSHRVESLAAELSMNLISVAMGSIEGIHQADAALAQASRTGSWVLVKNAHLSLNWLNSLEKKIDGIKESQFKLFITMEVKKNVSVNLIRRSRTMMFEPPSGVKTSLITCLKSISLPMQLSKPIEKYRLFFMLSWLHSIVTERLRYKSVGWTKTYDFNDSDFDMAAKLIDVLMERASETKTNIAPSKIPWDALQTLISRTVYGGKIDREADQVVVDILVKQYFNENVYNIDFTLVSKCGDEPSIIAPSGVKLEQYLEWASSWQDSQSPHWLGLPFKADYLLRTNQGIFDELTT